MERATGVQQICIEAGSWLLLGPGVASTAWILCHSWSTPERLAVYVYGFLSAAVSLPCFAVALRLGKSGRRVKWQSFFACFGLWVTLLIAPWPYQIRFMRQRPQFDHLAAMLSRGAKPSSNSLKGVGVRNATFDEAGISILEVSDDVTLRYSHNGAPVANPHVYDEILPLGDGWFWVNED